MIDFKNGFEKTAVMIYHQSRTMRGPRIKMRPGTRNQMQSRSKKRHVVGGAVAAGTGAGIGRFIKGKKGGGKAALIGAGIGAAGSIASRFLNKRKIKKSKSYSGRATQHYNYGQSGRDALRGELVGKYRRHIKSKGKDIKGFEAD